MEEPELEDGEIEDLSENIYIPLQRPVNYSQVQPNNRFPINLDSGTEEDLESSGSGTDSDEQQQKKIKRPKLKIKPVQRYLTKKKYDIWSARAKDDLLSETFVTCDVSYKDKSRSVEYYDYQLAFKMNTAENLKLNNKRTISDRKNPQFIQRQASPEYEERQIIPRNIMDLVVDIDNSEEEIAKDIANKLLEEKEELVLNIVNTLGKNQSIDFFKETQSIEAKGGMLIMNHTRRRTPGGVFLYLVRTSDYITSAQKKIIFNDDRISHVQKQRDKKKISNLKLRAEIGASREKILPELLSRTELLAKEENRLRREKDVSEQVINPPPTPEPQENDDVINPPKCVLITNRESPIVYDGDCFDLGGSNNMDLF